MTMELMVREGHVVNDDRDLQIDALTADVRQLKVALNQAKTDIAQAKRESTRALAALRKQLSPLYRALQDVFGELDAAGAEEPSASGSPTTARTAAVWESWKSRLGAAGKLIDALLLHGEMNTQQLAIATGLHRTTIPKHIYTLNKAGLLNKNGGRFSLKQL